MAAGLASRKRQRNDTPRGKPTKKQRKAQAYHSDSDEQDDEGQDFEAVNLLDSDNDIDNAEVDEGSASGGSTDGDADAGAKSPSNPRKQPSTKSKSTKPTNPRRAAATDAPASSDDDDKSPGTGSSEDDESGSDDEDDDANPSSSGRRAAKSKRNDPAAFATSLTKILNTKLSTSRRADPVLARSADAARSARAAVDTALEARARRRLRDAKRAALDRGRVRDVLVPTATAAAAGDAGEKKGAGDMDGASAAELLATEKRLRKVAQRGVVKLFNAVRAAQVKAVEAERGARAEGVIGQKGRDEKVHEMSRKGFLDLIAAGGGGLKKGGLEEA